MLTTHMRRLLIMALLVWLPPVPAADPVFSRPQQKAVSSPPALSSLAEAAKWADLVAIAQVEDIDYEKQRSLNASGTAWLKILVPYKGDATKNDYIEVKAQGFEDWACYYPDRLNEGHRYLVFLKKEKNGQYIGFKPWCQLQVLLDKHGQYNLRYPLDAQVPVPGEYIRDIEYNDPHALVDATEWSSLRREEWVKSRFAREIVTDQGPSKQYHMKYTKGIPVEHFRSLMQLEIKPRIHSGQI